MVKKEFIKKRLEDLIKETEGLLKTIPSLIEIDATKQDKEHIIFFDKWKLSCLNFLRASFGSNHYFYKNFKSCIDEAAWAEFATIGKHKVNRPYYYSREQIAKGYATLLFIKEQIELNLVPDAKHFYEAALFSNLIEQGFELLKNGYRHAAAIYGRLVIENTIRDLCRLNNIKDKEKLSGMLVELRKLDVIDLPIARVIQSKYDIGSLAVHGKKKFNKYSDRDIEEMLEFIRDKIITIE